MKIQKVFPNGDYFIPSKKLNTWIKSYHEKGIYLLNENELIALKKFLNKENLVILFEFIQKYEKITQKQLESLSDTTLNSFLPKLINIESSLNVDGAKAK